VKRVYSLKRRNLFKEVYRKGRKFRGKGIQIFVVELKENDEIKSYTAASSGYKQIKIGVTISKRYGKANARNRAKRRIKSICAELLNEMEDGYCMIIRPGINFKEISYEQSRIYIRSLLQKAGVINKYCF